MNKNTWRKNFYVELYLFTLLQYTVNIYSTVFCTSYFTEILPLMSNYEQIHYMGEYSTGSRLDPVNKFV